MNKKFILLILFIFSILGCGFFGVLDTNPYNDQPSDYKEYHEKMSEEIRQELLGISSEKVLEKLGKPAWINKLGNYQMITKFRENQFVFDGKKKCKMSDCPVIFADESWAYSWERKTRSYYSQHGYAVFFYKGKVVSVE